MRIRERLTGCNDKLLQSGKQQCRGIKVSRSELVMMMNHFFFIFLSHQRRHQEAAAAAFQP